MGIIFVWGYVIGFGDLFLDLDFECVVVHDVLQDSGVAVVRLMLLLGDLRLLKLDFGGDCSFY